MDLGLSGRRALVTGASQGIGAATARALVGEGVHVIAVARRRGPLEGLCAEIVDGGGSAEALVADVTAEVGVEAVRAAVAAGPVDVLVNNVGGAVARPFLEQARPEWEAALRTNLLSAVDMTTLVLAGMVERRWGRIVHVSSIAAREPGHSLAPYAAAKAALLSYSKSVSAAVARHGVRSTVVLPGLTATAAVDDQIAQLAAGGVEGDDAVAVLMGRRRRPAIGRMTTAREVGDAIAFLCSERAGAVTGVALPVDGGTLAGSW